MAHKEERPKAPQLQGAGEGHQKEVPRAAAPVIRIQDQIRLQGRRLGQAPEQRQHKRGETAVGQQAQECVAWGGVLKEAVCGRRGPEQQPDDS